MNFAQPAWIGIGIFACIAIFLLYRKLENERRKRLETFAAPRLLGRYTATLSTARRSIKKYLIIGAVFCCFIAIARPQYSYKWVDVKRKGIDIMFAIDTSKSMLTKDIKPSRLERAKFGILDFVQKLDGDRVGLLPFAGSSYLLCPLTLDYDAFNQSVGAVDTNIIPSGGTNISDTIRDAEKILSESSNHKILILLSDGENLEGDVFQAAREVAEKKMTIFTVGVGTAGGELIPVVQNGKTSFVKDEQGKFVTSKLDEEKLRKIAEITGGTYARLGADGSGLETIYKKKLSLLPKAELAERKQKVPIERYEWPLGAAIILLLIEFLLTSKNGSAPDYLNRIKTAGRRLRRTTIPSFLLLIPLLSFQHPLSVEASTGEEAFNQQNYIAASKFYSEKLLKHPDDARLHFNLGTAQYKNNLYDQAIESFEKSLHSDDPSLQKMAYYNRANSYYQKGKLSLQANPQLTTEQWKKSLGDYDACLALDQNMQDAKYNRNLVQQKLDLLKQQKQQKEDQQQNQDNKEQNNKDDQKQNKDQNKNQDQQQNSSSDESKADQNQQPQNQDSGEQQAQNKSSDQKSENGEQQQEKPQPSEQANDKKDGKDNITAANNDKSAENKENTAQQVAQAEPAKKDGEMSEKEARQLLQSLMADEGHLNFIPQRNNSNNQRDW